MTRTNAHTRKQKIRRNILNLAFLVLLLAALLIGLLVTVVFPHDLNEYENRYAEKLPRFTFASYGDGTFQDGVEDAFADQLPFAERMKAAYNDAFSRFTAKLLPRLLTAKTNDPSQPGPSTSAPVTTDPNAGKTADPGNSGTTEPGKDPNGTEPGTDPDPGTDDPNAGTVTEPGNDPNGGTNPPAPVDPGTDGDVPVKSYPHTPLPDVPGQPRILTAKKTGSGRIILTNMDPSEEIAMYVQLSDSVYLFRSHLVYSVYEYRYMKSALTSRAAALNAWMAAHPEVTCYAYFVERETELDLSTGRKMLSADYMMESLDIPAERKGIFRCDTYEEFDTYYYKGDHHWNGFGAYEGYRQILSMIFPGEAPMVPTAVKSAGLANGSKTKGNASVYCEEMSGYVFDWPAIEVTINGTSYPDYGFLENYFRQTEKEPGAENYTNYANCYGGDNGCTILRNAANANGNILVIGESYDNAVLKLLACHFTEVHSVDLRNYKAQIGVPFRFGDYIRDHNITKVLWNGCLDFWTSGAFNPID